MFQNNSFIDLLRDSPEMNMSCYLSDDDAVALPRVSELSSPIGGSVNVLDMINQDVMFSGYQGAKSNADTQVTYVRAAPSLAPSISAGEMGPSIPTTTSIDTFAKPLQAYVPPEITNRDGQSMIDMNQISSYRLAASKAMRATVNPFEVNPFVASPSTAKPFAATSSSTSGATRKDNSGSSSSSSSGKNARSKTHSSQKKSSSLSLKLSKKSSQSSAKSKKTSTPTHKKEVTSTAVGRLSSVTHTVTRTTQSITRTNNSTESTIASSKSVTATTSTVTSNIATIIERKAVTTEYTTMAFTTHTVTKPRAPVSIISPLRNTFLPPNMLYSTPTIITRSPSASAGTKPCEKYTIVPIPGTPTTRARTRIVIPVTLNAIPTSPVSTNTASTGCKHRPVQAASTIQCPNPAPGTSSITSRTIAHNTIALPPGATIYTAKNIGKRSRPAVSKEPQTFTILDSKGSYTTLTISPNLAAAAAGGGLNQAPTTTATTTGAVSNTSSATSDTPRPRSQLLIPIANSQVNTNTSLGYLVTSPIAPPATTAAVKPTTTIASHTITTISSEAMRRIRNRLIYNIPMTSGINTLPSSTVSGGSSRARGPVTIVANQLLPTVPRSDAPVTTASTTNPPLNRLVIPIMSNVHASTSHSAVSSQGAYIIAGVNQATTMPSDMATRASRVVIPIIHNSSGVVATTATMVPGCSSKPSPAVTTCAPAGVGDPYSKLRSRLTIQVPSTNDGSTAKTTSPITAYKITRTRAPQNVYTIPAGSTPCISVTKTSDVVRNPATMTLITFSPPSASGTASTHKSPAKALPSLVESAKITTTTPSLGSGKNRFVIKLATNATSAAASSTVTTSVSTPVTTAVVSATNHRFTEPQPISSRLRTFPGPRTYSLAQRTAAAVPTASQRGLARSLTPRIKKVITSPAPLQIFADVVRPPATQASLTVVTSAAAKSRFTLSQSSGSSSLVVPQYKGAVLKNISSLAPANTQRTSSRIAGPRVAPERFVLNRSVALLPHRRVAPGAGAAGTTTATSVSSTSQRLARSPDSRSQTARTTDNTPATTTTTNSKQRSG